MSIYFRKEKKRLNKHLMQFAQSVEKQLSYAIQSLSDLDKPLAQRVIQNNLIIRQSAVEMEEECLKLLALYQPVANDLRLIIAVLKINSDLERIGDHAVIIAEEAQRLVVLPRIEVPNNIYELSAQAKMMLRKGLLAFVESDIQVAEDILLQKSVIIELADDVYNHQLMAIKETVDNAEQYLAVIKISRQLQRVADHATHIAEDVCYLMNGEIIRQNS